MSSNNSDRKFHSVKMLQQEWFRLKTFEKWPKKFISTKALAKSGFYYLKHGDRVQCFFCRGIVAYWEQGDVPDEEHRKHFSSCPLMLGEPPVGNVPMDHSSLHQLMKSFTTFKLAQHKPASLMQGNNGAASVQLAKYSSLHARVQSFNSAHEHMFPDFKTMAEAGFLYTGASDFVLCYRCGGGLFNWNKARDDPWALHYQHYPYCPHVLLNKGLDREDNEVNVNVELKMNRRSVLSDEEVTVIMETPLAKRVLMLRVEEACVRGALKELLESRGLLPSSVQEALTVVSEWIRRKEKETAMAQMDRDEISSSRAASRSSFRPRAANTGLLYDSIGSQLPGAGQTIRHIRPNYSQSSTFNYPSTSQLVRTPSNTHSMYHRPVDSSRKQFYSSTSLPQSFQVPPTQQGPRNSLTLSEPRRAPGGYPQSRQQFPAHQNMIRQNISGVNHDVLLMGLAAKVARLRVEVQTAREALQCRCCKTAQAEILTLPCEHLHLCVICIMITNTCPTCNTPINGTVKPIMLVT